MNHKVLNDFVALTSRVPPPDPLAAGMRAAAEACGLKAVVWRDFNSRYTMSDAHVGVYHLGVRQQFDKKAEETGRFYFSVFSGDEYVGGAEDDYASVIEARLAAETWLRQELLQYIPYCIAGVDDVHSE